MKKKKVPSMVFNDGDYKYPHGLRVTDEDELDIKLKSGDWDTGPVDKLKNPIKKKKSADEKRAEILRLQEELDEEPEPEPGKKKDNPEPGRENTEKPEPMKKPTKEPGKKSLSQMTVPELLKVAEGITLKVDEDWTRTQLYNAIKKKKG